jgi:hypothetical protein
MECVEYLVSHIWIPLTEVARFLFNKDVLASFVGAVAGAGVILFIEHLRSQNKILASLNATKALLIGHLNELLNMKRQFALPHQAELLEVQKKYKEDMEKINSLPASAPRPILDISIRKFTDYVQTRSWVLLVSLDEISQYAGKNPKLLYLIMQAKAAMESLKEVADFRNALIKEIIESKESDVLKIKRLIGVSEKGFRDLRFSEACQGIVHATDASLFFIGRSVSELDVLAGKILPNRLKKMLVKFDIPDENYKELLPPDDFFPGWK